MQMTQQAFSATRLKWLLVLGVTLGSFVAGDARAQVGPPDFQRPDRQRPDRQQMELMRMWRLVNALQIDETQAAKVFPVFSRIRRQRGELTNQLRTLRVGLQEQLNQEASEQELLSQMRKIRVAEGEVVQLQEDFKKQLEGVLTTRQQARLMLFDDNFRQDLQSMVRRMRGLGGRGGGSGPLDRPRRGRDESER